MADIVATKFHVPGLRPSLIERERLVSALAVAPTCKLSLVSAPAGFGKSTLLAAWLRARERRFAWLALDRADNDPIRFMGHLLTALTKIRPDVGKGARQRLKAGRSVGLEPILDLVINDVDDDARPLVLVLDDYHVIKAASVHDAMTYLLEHLPRSMHVVIATRTDPPFPLARMRARGEMVEIRANDLRFSAHETAAFLVDGMGLTLSSSEVGALGGRTEGWIAGLQLVALALRGRDDAASFIETFTGSHHYIVDYLIEEVLELQPEPVQTFLLQTSILERLTGPLCDAVTGVGGGAAMLESLERSNLFLVRLDDERRWYRYHQLFAETLQSRARQLDGGTMAELHRRASRWFEGKGHLAEAADHALAAGDIEHAARLVEALAEALWPQGELVSLFAWLDRLPADVRGRRPRLLLAAAWARFLQRSYAWDEVTALLVEAEHHIRETRGRDGRHGEVDGVLAAIRAAVASAREDAPSTLERADEATKWLPRDARHWRTVLGVSSGIAHAALGNARAAERALGDAITRGESVSNDYMVQVATMNLARIHLVRGRLHAARELSDRALQMAGEQPGGSPIASYPHVVLGKLHYEWNDLVSAERHLTFGLERAREDGHVRAHLDGLLALATTVFAQGGDARSASLLEAAREVADGSGLPWADRLVAAHVAHHDLRHGDLRRAAVWGDASGIQAEREPAYPREFEQVTYARLLLALGRVDAALERVDRLQEAAEEAGRTGTLLQLLAIRALALGNRGNEAEARLVLERLLEEARPHGHARLFTDEGPPMSRLLQDAWAAGISTDYVARLLAAFPSAGVATAPARTVALLDVDLLNEREVSVLRLMSARRSDKEIARELGLSVSTVKWYSSRIYRKLGAHRRNEAVRKATALGIL